MDNYCEWHHRIVDVSFADDGFGNLVMTSVDLFWHNVENWIRMDVV